LLNSEKALAALWDSLKQTNPKPRLSPESFFITTALAISPKRSKIF
jgi:hypothetical protein